MPEKKSYGSCRGEFSRNDEQQQYLDLDPSEAARLIVALQRVVGDIIASDRRGSETDVRLWLHSRENDSVTVTVYRRGGKA